MLRNETIDDTLFGEFQKELEELDTFRDQYRTLYGARSLNPLDPGVRRVLDAHPAELTRARDANDPRMARMLDRHDPDIARLLEGLAFFTARTRQESQRAIARFERRALEELFPYLLSPMPSMALLVADGSSRVTEARTLPAGTEIRVRPARHDPSEPANPIELSYRTIRPLHVRPIQIDKGRFEMRRVPAGGFLLHLGLRSVAPRSEDVRRIELYANPQGDVLSALRLHYALKNHLAGASYVFSTPRGPSTDPANARLSFSPPREPFEAEPFAHPLERVRRALHFPLGSLSVSIDIERTPPEWTELTLVLRLSPTWPSGLVLGPGSFLLHATPMVNLRRELGEPIPFDGTKPRAGVVHPAPQLGYRPREILGVYESTPDGLSPMLPEPLADAEEYYAVDNAGGGNDRRVFLDIHMPRAFAEPTTLAVEAEWYQPDPGGVLAGALEAAPASRHLDGLRWQVASPVQPSAESPLEGRRDRLSRLLHWSSSRALDRKAIVFLLELHGAAADDRWRRVLASIHDFSCDEVPDVRSKSGRKTVYRLTLRALPPTLRPSADFLFARLPELLAAWTSDDDLEVQVQTEAGDGADVTYKPEEHRG